VELALNLVWLVLATVSFVFGTMHASAVPRRYSNLATAIALICIACFLFPVISISDDLNNSPALCETSKSKGCVSADDLTHARLVSELLVPPHPGPAWGHASHLFAEIPASQAQIWFNLDRRPPPQHS
jgi:hypothetical protein